MSQPVASTSKCQVVKKVAVTLSPIERAVVGKMKVLLEKYCNVEGESQTCLVYPGPTVPRRLSLTLRDLQKLVPPRWLNDEIIDFYLLYLLEDKFPYLRSKYEIQSTVFYQAFTNYLKSPGNFNQRRLKTFRAKENIFEKEFVVIPLNLNNNHWFVLVICYTSQMRQRLENMYNKDKPKKKCNDTSSDLKEVEDSKVYRYINEKEQPVKFIQHKKPCLLIFDSLRFDDRTFFPVIRKYLSHEYERFYKKKVDFEELPGYFAESPMQSNIYDCGVFALHSVECFMQINFDNVQNYPPDFRHLFEDMSMKYKRFVILRLIVKLIKKQSLSETN